jgi:ABC-type nitrate/sulfonate/bicarbonate transport system, ATPase component
MATSAARSAPASQVVKGEPRIRVRGLGKRYDTLEVFRNIDFDVGEREIVAIVGPSGCGKTTLLRCIDGLLPHDAGEIRVGDERVTEPIAGVAMVFQHFGLFPWKTVFENVAYGLRMAGDAKIRDRTQGAGIHQARGPERLRKCISLSDVGWHAATLWSRPRARG